MAKAKKKSSKKKPAKTKPAKKAVKKSAKKASKKIAKKVTKKSASKKTAAKKKPAKKTAKKQTAKKKAVKKNSVKGVTKKAVKKTAAKKISVKKDTDSKKTSSKKNYGSLIHPLADRLVVRVEGQSERTPGGLYIPATVEDRPYQGEVLACGPGAKTKKGTLKPLDVKTGDRVLFNAYAGVNTQIEGEEVLILREDEVLGILSE